MRKLCMTCGYLAGQTADNSAVFSPLSTNDLAINSFAVGYRQFMHSIYTRLSTMFLFDLTVVRSWLYPLSTEPTITTTLIYKED